MNVTIEHPFCPYCSEVTNLYFRIINTLLFSKDENELRTSMESLKKETRLDEYFRHCPRPGSRAMVRNPVTQGWYPNSGSYETGVPYS